MYDNSLLLWYVLVMNNNTHQYERVQANSQQDLDAKMGWQDPVDENPNNGWRLFGIFMLVVILLGGCIMIIRAL
jgi:hypothetical protein